MRASRNLAATIGFSLAIAFATGCAKVDVTELPSMEKATSDADFNEPYGEIVPGLEVCEGISCVLNPLTQKPAVTTILIALGDEAHNQLVVNGSSAQLIAETVVRYTSPKSSPRILLVKDHNSGDESQEDTTYVANVLLARYDVTFLQEDADGITDRDVAGYDIVWYNNPGRAMGRKSTRDVLLRFAGGVILQGDDLSRGESGFDMEPLTGLQHVDNGTEVVCAGRQYKHDSNDGEKYRVSLNPNKMPAASASALQFRYGNDIDLSIAVRPGLEILANAKGGPSSCTETRPAIVRYTK